MDLSRLLDSQCSNFVVKKTKPAEYETFLNWFWIEKEYENFRNWLHQNGNVRVLYSSILLLVPAYLSWGLSWELNLTEPSSYSLDFFRPFSCTNFDSKHHSFDHARLMIFLTLDCTPYLIAQQYHNVPKYKACEILKMTTTVSLLLLLRGLRSTGALSSSR